MTKKIIKIAIDAMGGDRAPNVPIDGMKLFIRKNRTYKVKFILYGDESILRPKLRSVHPDDYEIVHCDKYIASDEKPSHAVRHSFGTSMREAISAVSKNECDACVSGGNTGALMALSKLILKTTNGINRPAICSTIPTSKGKAVLLDMGANIEVSAKNLYEFAIMGSAYAKVVLGKKHPKIGLLNIGSEDMKGHAHIKEAADMIQNSALARDFIGNIEPDKIYDGDVDVIVTDGFTGNVVIKSAEGLGRFTKNILKNAFKSSLISLTGYGLAKRSLKIQMKAVDPNNYNGAMFVGLNGVSVKSHGGADKFGFANAIINAVLIIHEKMNDKIIENINYNDL